MTEWTTLPMTLVRVARSVLVSPIHSYMFDVYKLIAVVGVRFSAADGSVWRKMISWAYRAVRPDAVYDTGAPRARCLNPPWILPVPFTESKPNRSSHRENRCATSLRADCLLAYYLVQALTKEIFQRDNDRCQWPSTNCEEHGEIFQMRTRTNARVRVIGSASIARLILRLREPLCLLNIESCFSSRPRTIVGHHDVVPGDKSRK